MTNAMTLAEAKAEAERRRARLLGTVEQLSVKLEPKRLARGLWEDAKVKGADLAEDAVDAVKARPLAATGVIAAIAMFLAREPLMDAAGKVGDAIGEKRKAKKARKAEKAQKARAAPKSKPRRRGAANDELSPTESA